MIDIFPNKSLFGLKILNSLNSTLFSYALIIWLLIQISLFNYFGISSFSSNLFILIANLSIFILIVNAVIRRKKKSYIINWFFLNFPLWVYLPFLVRMIYLSSANIYMILQS